ncbi:MAG: YitT family protein [Desulfobacterales bacterium]
MKKHPKVPKVNRKFFSDLKTVVFNLSLIFFGSLIYVIGMNSILIPARLLSGGVTGIAVLLHYLFSNVNFGLVYFLLNVPMIIIGWIHVSGRFMIYTIIGIFTFSGMASIIHLPAPDINDPILSALFAGVVCGTGAGIILRSLGSAGGLDILVVVLNKYYGLRPGTIYSMTNILIIFAGAFFHNFELALYSIIFVYTSGQVVDKVLTGFNQRKAMMIISDKSEVIAAEILSRQNRGVTFFQGTGAYTGKDKKVIFTIMSLTELPKTKEFVFQIDPNAFMVINDTLEVLGKRHGKLRAF